MNRHVDPRVARTAARRVGEVLVFGVLPVAVFSWWIAFAVLDEAGDWAFDFTWAWEGGKSVLEGESPYPSAALLATAGDHLDPVEIQETFRFAYPAFAAIVYAPFGALPFDAAAALWGVALGAALLGALLILDVRDWRVFGVVVGSTPVIGAIRIGTLTPVLILLVALAWRWRDRTWLVALSLATAVALKLFPWPLVVWLVATRRWTAAVAASALSAALVLGSWAVIGFDGLRRYPELVRELSEVVQDRGFSLVALGVEAGMRETFAEALPLLVGIAMLGAVVALAREADGDRRAFSVAVVASIAFAPIVWLHYFALLVVPLALARPQLSWVWLTLWVFWLVPAQENEGDLWRILLAAALTAVVAVAVSTSGRGRERERTRAFA